MRLMNLSQSALAAGVTLFSIGTLFHFAVPFLVPALATAYIDHSALFRIWPGWTRSYMLCHPFVYGFVFACGFHAFHAMKKESIHVGTMAGALYGVLVFAIGSLPVYSLNYGSLRLPGIVITSWVVQSLLQYTAAGTVLGCMTDRVLAIGRARSAVEVSGSRSDNTCFHGPEF